MKRLSISLIGTFTLFSGVETRTMVNPRHCHGNVRHLHLSVGRDPSREMIVSFATTWAKPGVVAPVTGLHIGLKPDKLDRFIPEQEDPIKYNSPMPGKDEIYDSPFQHHITIDGLEPNTTYYYVAVVGDRAKGIEKLDHPIDVDVETLTTKKRDQGRRRLSPPPYDGSDGPCIDGHQVRSFTTAPESSKSQVAFAMIGDLGQFTHSMETLEHLREHRDGINVAFLVGDLAYADYDPRRWDTFMDFLDDHSIFDEVPMQIATGNHDIEKQEGDKFIFQAYESRFRMPRVHPPELGLFDAEEGMLDMEAAYYPLPYEWGNAYYSFVYGPTKHIIISAYSSMEPESTQYKWVVNELESIDREVTPWVIVSLHTPIYNTFSLHGHDPQIFAAKEHMEPLWVKHHVNVVFTGHIHAYQRTFNVAMDKVTKKGPVHITIGAGGRACDAPYKTENQEEWLAKRDASFHGYGRISIFNHTHAEWKWIPISPSDKHDYNYVKHQKEVHLPQLMYDEVVLENQYYMD